MRGGGGAAGGRRTAAQNKKKLESKELNTDMPLLSKLTHCPHCASPEHKAPNCPRRVLSAKAAAAKAKADAKAGVRAAAKEAAVSKKAAAKAKAAAKRLAARAITLAKKAFKRNQDAFHNAVYVALIAVVPVPKTPGSFKNSRWAVVADICVRCERPPLGCFCNADA